MIPKSLNMVLACVVILAFSCFLGPGEVQAQEPNCMNAFLDLRLESDYRKAQSSILADERLAWRLAVTDPSFHDSRSFAYLVHGVVNEGRPLAEIADFIVHGPKLGGYRISMSFVTSAKPFSVLGEVGFILSVNPQDILAAHPRDFNILNEAYAGRNQSQKDFKDKFRLNSENELYQVYRKRFGVRILSPDELIRQSSVTEYNEVLGLNSGDSNIAIVGIFINQAKQKRSGESAKREKEAYQLARELGLPLVLL